METKSKLSAMFFSQNNMVPMELKNPRISSKLPKIELIFPQELNLIQLDEALCA